MTSKEGALSWVTNNLSYKVFALLITLVLWFTILGRRDLVVSKQATVEILVPQHLVLANEPAKSVTVKVSGPRTALKKFREMNSMVTLNLNHRSQGKHIVEVRKSLFDLPVGARILSIDPKVIEAVLRAQRPNEKKESDDNG